MIPFENEPAFVLYRRPYKENNYLIDIFTLNLGFFCIIARIQNTKTHRKTNSYSPFCLLHISGHRKGELASVWQAEVQYDFTPKPAQLLSAHYLNETLLGLLPPDEPAPAVFHQYLLALQQTSGLALRQFEHTLLIYLGLLPEIEQDADFYHLDLSGDTATLRPASRGYSRQNLTRLLSEHPDWQHPETRQLLQSLVRFYSHRRAETKKTAIALRQLLQPLPT
jgi:recombination protein O C terminal